MQINVWSLFVLIANAQYLLSGGMCGGGHVTRVHPAYNLQECEFNCDRDGKFYGRTNTAKSFSFGSFIRGRGDCLCSTQCTCLDSRRPDFEVSMSTGSNLPTCDQGTVEGMNLDSCHFFTDQTWSKTRWVQYECNSDGGVTQIFYNYQTHCRAHQHIQRSYDFLMDECFEHFPGERIKVSYCSGNQLHFTYCGTPTSSPSLSPTITTTTTLAPVVTSLPVTTKRPTRPPSRLPTPGPTLPPIWNPYVSTLLPDTTNITGLAGEERGSGDDTVVGMLNLSLPVIIAIVCLCICFFAYCFYLSLCSKSRKSKSRKPALDHALLQEDSNKICQRFDQIHDKNHWQSPVRAYPYSIDMNDITDSISDNRRATHGRDVSNDLSMHDKFLISTLPVTPQQQRDHFWKRDPSMSDTLSYQEVHDRYYVPQQGKKFTEEIEGYSSEQVTSESSMSGRSTHRSHTPAEKVGFKKRFSLRALDPQNNNWNELSDEVVMSKRLASYLQERNLHKFIPDLESFGVARASDLMELHRSDINSFQVEPTREERQKLENIFLLGAIE